MSLTIFIAIRKRVSVLLLNNSFIIIIFLPLVYISEIKSLLSYIKVLYEILEKGSSDQIIDPFEQISCKYINSSPINHIEENISLFNVSLGIESTDNVTNYNIDPKTAIVNINIINDLISKLFWVGYVGHDKLNIQWGLFSVYFMKSYGYQNLHVMKRLKRKLCLGDNGNTNDSETVSIITYAAFCNNGDGLMSAFQRECDPGTLVMYSGKFDFAISKNDNNNRIGALNVMDCLIGIKVNSISCGGQHCAICTSEGKVLTWGKGSYGRLGHGNVTALETPTMVQSLSNEFVTKVTCGFAFTSAITNEGVVYCWGAGENGRLGLGDNEDKLNPTKNVYLIDYKVVEICAGSVHSSVLTSKGLVLSYGKLEYTGHGHTCHEDILIPTLLDHFDGIPIKKISSGFGGYHTLALTERGVLYAWGHNRVSQTGIPNNEQTSSRNSEGAFYIAKPTAIPDFSEAIKSVSAGWGHSVVITESGKAYSCGRNTNGQLGLGDLKLGSLKINERGHTYQPYFRKLLGLENVEVSDVYAGGEHSIFRIRNETDNGNLIYSCGSNVYGQICQNVDVIDDQNCCFYDPTFSKQLKSVGRRINQIICGGEISFFIFGTYEPSSLHDLCSNIIKQNPDKYKEQDLSHYELEKRHE